MASALMAVKCMYLCLCDVIFCTDLSMMNTFLLIVTSFLSLTDHVFDNSGIGVDVFYVSQLGSR
jgi:hypothetical protein